MTALTPESCAAAAIEGRLAAALIDAPGPSAFELAIGLAVTLTAELLASEAALRRAERTPRGAR